MTCVNIRFINEKHKKELNLKETELNKLADKLSKEKMTHVMEMEMLKEESMNCDHMLVVYPSCSYEKSIS